MIIEILKSKVSLLWVVIWFVIWFIFSFLVAAYGDLVIKNKTQKIQTLTVERDAVVAQLQSLKVQSEAQKSRVESANKNAELDLKTSKLDIKKLLDSKIPQNCGGAVNWAREQAATL